MSDAQLYAPDYLRMQKDEQLHRIAEMIERMIERKSTLEKKLAKAKSALEFYGNEMNYSVDDYHGISGEMRRRCVLYTDCEERNDVYSYAGLLARTTLAEIGD